MNVHLLSDLHHARQTALMAKVVASAADLLSLSIGRIVTRIVTYFCCFIIEAYSCSFERVPTVGVSVALHGTDYPPLLSVQ